MLTLLLPLDGSPYAEHALPLALRIAQRCPTRLELVSVHEPPFAVRGVHGAPIHDPLDRLRAAEVDAELRRYLDGIRRRVEADHLAAAVRTVLLEGPRAETIAAHAEEIRADAVVMTTHGRGGVSRLWLGSLTEALVRGVAVPVIATRPARGRARRAELGAIDAPIRRVLVALDGAPENEAVVESLRTLAGMEGVEYVLMRAVAPLHPVLRAVATDDEYVRDLRQQQYMADDYLADVAGRLRAQGFATSVRTRPDVSPARAITACAKKLGVDLIALATHGRGPAGRVLFGSVADKVLRTASTPVLLHRIPPAAARDATAVWDAPGAATPSRAVESLTR